MKRKLCKCSTEDGLQVVQKHLAKSREILDSITDDKKNKHKLLRRQLKELKISLQALQVLIEKHTGFEKEYAMNMLDLVKKREINTSSLHKKMKTVPWLTGIEKTRAEEARIQALQEKKSKRK